MQFQSLTAFLFPFFKIPLLEGKKYVQLSFSLLNPKIFNSPKTFILNQP